MMPTLQERAEMEAVLRSGIFERAPRLCKFFVYICESHLDGLGHQIKEYSIAVEALGRSSEFDPKKDSIVRVEAHRLRKRLEDYYHGPGADHSTRIIIPNGQYRPEFISVTPTDPAPADTAVTRQDYDSKNPLDMSAMEPVFRPDGPDASGLVFAEPFGASDPDPARASRLHAGSPNRYPSVGFITVSVLFVLAVATFALHLRSDRALQAGAAQEAAQMEAANISVGPQSGGEIRILAGYRGRPYVDRQGHLWRADTFFSGGQAIAVPASTHIEGQPDPHLIRSFRAGKFHYDIPLPPGVYELHLLFAETEFGSGSSRGGAEGTRTFRVLVNGGILFPQFDSVAQAGAPNRMHEQVIKDIVPAADHKLHLEFDPIDQQAEVNALAVLPSSPGRIHPIRLVSQFSPTTDSEGRVWAADEYFIGGSQVERANVTINSKDRFLYEGERFGNFAYRIPLATGKYKLTLHFAEQWFGTLFSGMQSVKTRAFDVYANRGPLVRNFSPALAGGGPNHPVSLSFDKVEPNAQGVLLLEFVPIRNYAEINAIEVVETE